MVIMELRWLVVKDILILGCRWPRYMLVEMIFSVLRITATLEGSLF